MAEGAQGSTPALQTLPPPWGGSCSGCRSLALVVSPGFSDVPLGAWAPEHHQGLLLLDLSARGRGITARGAHTLPLVLSLLFSIFIAFLSSFGTPGCLSLPAELPPVPESFVRHTHPGLQL